MEQTKEWGGDGTLRFKLLSATIVHKRSPISLFYKAVLV